MELHISLNLWVEGLGNEKNKTGNLKINRENSEKMQGKFEPSSSVGNMIFKEIVRKIKRKFKKNLKEIWISEMFEAGWLMEI